MQTKYAMAYVQTRARMDACVDGWADTFRHVYKHAHIHVHIHAYVLAPVYVHRHDSLACWDVSVNVATPLGASWAALAATCER